MLERMGQSQSKVEHTKANRDYFQSLIENHSELFIEYLPSWDFDFLLDPL